MRLEARPDRALIRAAGNSIRHVHVAQAMRPLVAVLLALAACGGDDSSGGLVQPGPSQPANVAGNWTFNWTNMAGTHPSVGSFACNVNGVHATLTQTNATFSGTINGDWSISCSGGGQTVSDTFTGGLLRARWSTAAR